MKKDWFFFPFGGILRSMGGIPVDRSHSGSMVDQLAERIKESSKLSIAITPEGTRRATDRWKTGFYRIACAANIPIQLAVIDYKKRELGILETFYPTGNEEADIRYIRSRYHSEQARFPKNFVEQ
jgi:acyltransferase family protein